MKAFMFTVLILTTALAFGQSDPEYKDAVLILAKTLSDESKRADDAGNGIAQKVAEKETLIESLNADLANEKAKHEKVLGTAFVGFAILAPVTTLIGGAVAGDVEKGAVASMAVMGAEGVAFVLYQLYQFAKDANEAAK